MIKVVVYKNHNKEINGFEVTGHAQFRRYGQDIVCSAVSALTQTAVLGLVEVAKIKVKYEIEDGYLNCTLPEKQTDTEKLLSRAILQTMFVGLKNIKESYNKYVELEEEEV